MSDDGCRGAETKPASNANLGTALALQDGVCDTAYVYILHLARGASTETFVVRIQPIKKPLN